MFLFFSGRHVFPTISTVLAEASPPSEKAAQTATTQEAVTAYSMLPFWNCG